VIKGARAEAGRDAAGEDDRSRAWTPIVGGQDKYEAGAERRVEAEFASGLRRLVGAPGDAGEHLAGSVPAAPLLGFKAP
jgi:hypothetical protein